MRASRGAAPRGPAVLSGAEMNAVLGLSPSLQRLELRRHCEPSDADGIPRADRGGLSSIARGCVPSRSFAALGVRAVQIAEHPELGV